MDVKKTFSQLLDFSDVFQRSSEVSDRVLSRCWDISDFLMSHFCLFSQLYGESFVVTSLEFYLYKRGIFEDTATHGGFRQMKDHPQLSSGRFYVHFPKNLKTIDMEYPIFKPPQRFGIDITCGNRERGIYGGILIKGLDGLDGSKSLLRLIRGKDSLKLSIKRSNQNTTWADREGLLLKEIHGSDIFNPNSPIFLKEKEVESISIHCYKRIGIERTCHASMPLRFFRFK